MNDFTIFIIEDDKWYGELLEYHLANNPEYIVKRFTNGRDALANMYLKPCVVTLDYSLPDLSGEAVLKKIKQGYPETDVVMISGQEDVATAVNLLKEGAYDYIVKDDEARNRLWNIIIKIREHQAMRGEIEQLREEIGRKYDFENTIIGKSPAITKIYQLIGKACKTNITASISGETGTGKELVAKAIHYNSPRKKKNFIAVNMAAIPKELIESELFGHEKGAFTGAIASKNGSFEEANGGTLFLDEIGEMDMSLQAKILRAIQEREVVRIGGNKPIKLDVRILVATHKNLADEVRKGNFREDLYYRLLGLPIHIPPLRERGNDVLILAKHFADEFCKENKLPKLPLGQEAKQKLLKYPFPGNVRELKAIIELALVMADGSQIEPDDITFSALNEVPEVMMDEEMTLDDYNQKIIQSYLKKYDNNIVKVASKLGIGKSTLYRMRKNDEI